MVPVGGGRIPFLGRSVHAWKGLHCDPDGERQREEEEQRKINDGARERLNVRPASINIHRSRRRRWPRDWPTFCTRPAKISARQYRTMPDCRHYGGHCRGSWYEPCCLGYTSCNIVAISPSSPFVQSSPFRSRYRRRGLLGKERTCLWPDIVLLLNYVLSRGWDQFREWNWGRRLIFNSWLKGWAKVGAIFIIIRESLYFFFCSFIKFPFKEFCMTQTGFVLNFRNR